MKHQMTSKARHIYWVMAGLILLLAVFFRFAGLNWDQGQHLHPDERFLTMVMGAMRIPASVDEYFDQDVSLLNPENIGYDFYVYGILPLSFTKLIAMWTTFDSYSGLTQVGRFLAAGADVLVVLLVFLTARTIQKHYKLHDNFPLWPMLVYALAVLPIQLAHFFAVDAFLNLFMFGAFYFCLLFGFRGRWYWLLFGGVSFGLALATKLNALYVLPLLLVVLILTPWLETKRWLVKLDRSDSVRNLLNLRVLGLGILTLLSFLLVSYLVLRMVNPYTFENGSWINPLISRSFIENIKSLKTWEGADVWFPPAIQWITKPAVVFSLSQLAIVGVGLVSFVFVILGIGWAGKRWWSNRWELMWMLLLIWVGAVFVYQSVQFVKALRYFIFLYPYLALFAGLGIMSAVEFLKNRFGWSRRFLSGVIVVLLLLWPVMFMSIYVNRHSRVEASEWIYDNIPAGSYLLAEHWDDALPLPIEHNNPQRYRIEQLPVFDRDTEQKWVRMQAMLDEADYYVLSSNRAWGSITTVPDKYPQMSAFYEDLLKERTDYKRVAEFTSYPSLSYLGIPLTIPDDWADETFTVYDHPKVLIFQRN